MNAPKDMSLMNVIIAFFWSGATNELQRNMMSIVVNVASFLYPHFRTDICVSSKFRKPIFNPSQNLV